MTPEHNRKATESQLSLMPTASIEAGLAAAFQRSGDANSSVLQSIHKDIGPVPSVILRPPTSFDHSPVLQTQSAEMPSSESHPRYRVDGQIAKGGMGAILQGRDKDLGRDLAIKVLLDSHKDKPAVIQRFIEEAQIGGQLQHPGIAPVYELGQFADKRPFFTMKLVKGKTLAALLDGRKSVDSDRTKFIGIFEQVCQTMAYAHSRGVIHRDLKPANIMVGAFGEVQVMDWGLAKVLNSGGVADEKKANETHQDRSIIETLRSAGSNTSAEFGSQTQMGSVMGTPAYMPPEQALGEIDQLDQRADVFGLGAILCEILTGKPPYVADDSVKIFRHASRGKLDDCLKRLDDCNADIELVAIAKTAISAEPSDRPCDASVLAERISSHQEAVENRLRESEIDRAAQTVRADEERKRRRVSLALAASVLMLILTVGGTSLWMQTQKTAYANELAAEEANKVEAEKAANEQLRRVLYQSDIRRALAEIHQGNHENAKSILTAQIPDETKKDLRGFEWHYLYRLCPKPTKTKLFNWEDGRVLTVPEDWDGSWRKFYDSVSRDGRRIARVYLPNPDGKHEVAVWSTETGRKVWSQQIDVAVREPLVRLNEDGTVVALSTVGPLDDEQEVEIEEAVYIWDLSSDRPVSKISADEIPSLSGTGTAIDFRPQSSCISIVNRICDSSEDSSDPQKGGPGWKLPTGNSFDAKLKMHMWDYQNGELRYSIRVDKVHKRDSRRRSVAFSSDGRYIAMPSSTNEFLNRGADLGIENLQQTMEVVRILDAETGDEVNQLRSTAFRYSADCAFSPDGNLLAIAGRNTSFYSSREHADVDTVLIWDISSGHLVSTARSRAGAGIVRFSSSGEYVIVDPLFVSNPEVYRVADGAPVLQIKNPDRGYVHFSDDENHLQAITSEGDLLRWQLPKQQFSSRDYVRWGRGQVSGDGRRVLRIDSGTSETKVFDITGRLLDTLHLPWKPADVYALPTEQRRRPKRHESVLFNHDGSKLTVLHYSDPETQQGASLSVWDLDDDKVTGTLFQTKPEEKFVIWEGSPTSPVIAAIVAAENDQLVLMDQDAFTERRIDIQGHTRGLGFSLDGKLLALSTEHGTATADIHHPQKAVSERGKLTIYDVQTGAIVKSLATIRGYTNIVFSHDARLVATTTNLIDCQQLGEVEIWNLETRRRHQALPEPSKFAATSMAFSPEDDRLLIMKILGEGVVNRYSDQLEIWNVDTGAKLLDRTYYGRGGMRVKFLPGQHRLFGYGKAGPPQIWDGTPVIAGR